jgi:hypothetical protein
MAGEHADGAGWQAMMTDDEILFGRPGVIYQGLLSQPCPPRPTPPGTMTRQRRRAEARAAAKR